MFPVLPDPVNEADGTLRFHKRPVSDDLWNGGGATGDDGPAGGHCPKKNDAKALLDTLEPEEAGAIIRTRQFVQRELSDARHDGL